MKKIVLIVTTIKVVDYQVLTKHCSGCKMREANKENQHGYDLWKANHICNISQTKSSGTMEAAGAIDIFNRSIDKNNLIYHEYLGDDDTSLFKEVVDANPYEKYDIIPSELECIGHVQKRLGTRLCNCVKSHKGTNQPISGKGKFTEKVINSMQNYYGMAIRNNVDDIHNMRKARGAVLYHCTDFKNQDYRHGMCSNDGNS